MVSELESLAKRIEAGIRRQGRYYASAPAELAQLGDLPHAVDFARQHHWMVVPQLAGEAYEFFEATASPQQVLF